MARLCEVVYWLLVAVGNDPADFADRLHREVVHGSAADPAGWLARWRGEGEGG